MEWKRSIRSLELNPFIKMPITICSMSNTRLLFVNIDRGKNMFMEVVIKSLKYPCSSVQLSSLY